MAGRIEDRYAAVVLTGGGSRRLGGGDKTGLEVAGVPIWLRALRSVADAKELLVVGPSPAHELPDLVPPQARWVREEPPGGGPLAGLAAALPLVTVPIVVVLAGDLPFTAGVAGELLSSLAAAPVAGGVVPVDATGRSQPLAAAYRTDALRAGLGSLGDPRDRPVRDLLPLLRVVGLPASSLPHGALADVDTPGDLAAARSRAGNDYLVGD